MNKFILAMVILLVVIVSGADKASATIFPPPSYQELQKQPHMEEA